MKLIKTEVRLDATKRCWHDVANMLKVFEREDESIMEIIGIDDYPSIQHAYDSIWMCIHNHKKDKSIAIKKRKDHIYLVKLI